MLHQADQGIDIEVRFDEIAEQLEAVFAGPRERRPGDLHAEGLAQECSAQRVTFERAVPHRAEHPARARPTQELVGVGAAGDAAVVDLVSGSRDTRPLSGGQPKSLLGNEIRLDIEQTKTVYEFQNEPDAAAFFDDSYLPKGDVLLMK